MVARKKISDDIRQQIIDLYNDKTQKISQKELAERFGLHQPTISAIISKARAGSSQQSQPAQQPQQQQQPQQEEKPRKESTPRTVRADVAQLEQQLKNAQETISNLQQTISDLLSINDKLQETIATQKRMIDRGLKQK